MSWTTLIDWKGRICFHVCYRRSFNKYIFENDLELPYRLQSLPRLKTDSLQRSDGEEEEDGSLTLSPVGPDVLPANWDGLAIPVPAHLKQEGPDGVSVSLGDLVRHMHPYCMTISVENEEGEHILPEGGILLEVVDQGENGEPILVIPDVDLPASLPCGEQSENEETPSGEAGASNGTEHLIVDEDEVIHSEDPAKMTAPLKTVSSYTKGEMVITRQKEGIKEKSPSRRKKKKKTKTKSVEEKDPKAQPKEPERMVEGGIKEDASTVPPDSASPLPVEPQKPNPSCGRYTENATTTPGPETQGHVQPPASLKLQEMPSNSPPDAVARSQQARESGPGDLDPVSGDIAGCSTPPLVISDTPPSPSQPVSPDVSNGPPPAIPLSAEPKPKSLSLAEYRRLRQQKKPTPVEKPDGDHSSKWPSLPVLPKELPPIPCLPHPSTRDPRRTNPHTGKREAEEVKPAWQPRGPCAPPTPEALLVPPAYMVASAGRVPAATSQQSPEMSKSPSAPQLPPSPGQKVTVRQHRTTVPTGPRGSSDPEKSEDDKGFNQRPVELKTCPKTTTETVKATAAPMSAPVTSERSAALAVVARAVTAGAGTSHSKSSKVSSTTVASAAQASDSLALKMEPANKDRPSTVGQGERPKLPTQELIEAFTSEIGEFTLQT